MIHDVNAIDLNPKAAGFAAVISGHSHKPKQELKDGVLYSIGEARGQEDSVYR